jgi:hypothetical protein
MQSASRRTMCPRRCVSNPTIDDRSEAEPRTFVKPDRAATAQGAVCRDICPSPCLVPACPGWENASSTRRVFSPRTT